MSGARDGWRDVVPIDEPCAGALAAGRLSEADGPALARALAAGAAGILLLDTVGPADVTRVAARLAVAEAETNRSGAPILAHVGSAAGVAALAGFGRPSPRLAGIVLDGPALAVSLGGAAGPAADTARGLTLIAAAAAGVPAIERTDDAGRARAPGFAAVLRDADPQDADGLAIEKTVSTTA